MDYHKLVLPEHMNIHGALFGGYLLKWIDEFAYITACLDFPEHRFVTIALNQVVFNHPILCGEILRFNIEQSRIGNTSVEYEIAVYGENKEKDGEKKLFQTQITFVNTDKSGLKSKIRHQ